MRKIIALVFLCLTLTSCMRADMTLTISSDDKVNGELTIAFSEEALKELDVTSDQLLENENLFGNSDSTGIDTTDYKKDGMIGKTYTFTDLPLSELANAFGSDGQSLAITRKGDQILTSGVMDLTQGTTELDEKTQKLFSTLTSTIIITYPGTIVSTTGEQDGNTVTWVTKVGEKSDFTTVVDSTFEIPANLGTPTDSTTSSGLVFAALAFVAGLVGFTLVRRKKDVPSTDAPASTPEASPEA